MSVSAYISPSSMSCSRHDVKLTHSTAIEFSTMGTEVIMQEMVMLEPLFRAAFHLLGHVAFLAFGLHLSQAPDRAIDFGVKPMVTGSQTRYRQQD